MKYRSLESFRGIAAILVSLFHSAFVVSDKYVLIARSAIFVDFFFILSGFVIAFAYRDRIKAGFSFNKFVLLRLGRLYPLHLFILLIWLPYIVARSTAFHKLGLGETDPLLNNGIASFFSNIFLINALGVHDSLSWNFPAWSISVEFFTYIIFFSCISLFRKVNDLTLCLVVSVLCYYILYLNNPHTLLKTYDWGLVRCIGGFFLGAVVYRISQKLIFKQSVLLATLLEILSVLIMLILVVQSLTVNYQLASFISFAFVILVFSVQEVGLLTKILTIRPILFLGTLSYSIYMVHALFFAVSSTIGKRVFGMPHKVVENKHESFILLMTPYANLINILVLFLVIICSYLTYRYIEVPWRDRFRGFVKNNE